MYDHLATASAYENLSCGFNHRFVISQASGLWFQVHFSVDDGDSLCYLSCVAAGVLFNLSFFRP